jgi:hypothetical protein
MNAPDFQRGISGQFEGYGLQPVHKLTKTIAGFTPEGDSLQTNPRPKAAQRTNLFSL